MSLQANVHFYDHSSQEISSDDENSFCVGANSYIDVSGYFVYALVDAHAIFYASAVLQDC